MKEIAAVVSVQRHVITSTWEESRGVAIATDLRPVVANDDRRSDTGTNSLHTKSHKKYQNSLLNLGFNAV